MVTRGEKMLALRRSRMAAAPAFLRGGFRPFFFSGAAWAVIALALWLTTLAGAIVLPSAFDPLAWHRHEMLFGFVGAIIAGFLLTAIPNWTGRLPIAGPPLAGLLGLWLAARAAVFFSGTIGLPAAAVLDVGFYFVLAGVAAREVIAAGNRNIPVVGLVGLFGIANAIDHLAMAGLVDPGLGWRSATTLIIVMISLIGGRIVPSFTRNWLAKKGVKHRLPGQPGRFDIFVVAATAVAMIVWTVLPQAVVAGVLLIAAALLQAVRMSRWGGLRAARDPFVFVLHMGYAWVPIGLALLGGSLLVVAIPPSAAIHALTAGAMATMILAVMTRSTLGHTGRELKADAPTVLIYLLVTAGAVLRVTSPLGLVDYTAGMEVAAIFWGGAFVLFLGVYGPMLFAPRADGKL